jgi:hypothetical protein
MRHARLSIVKLGASGIGVDGYTVASGELHVGRTPQSRTRRERRGHGVWSLATKNPDDDMMNPDIQKAH